jgi:hypothetical protein
MPMISLAVGKWIWRFAKQGPGRRIERRRQPKKRRGCWSHVRRGSGEPLHSPDQRQHAPSPKSPHLIRSFVSSKSIALRWEVNSRTPSEALSAQNKSLYRSTSRMSRTQRDDSVTHGLETSPRTRCDAPRRLGGIRLSACSLLAAQLVAGLDVLDMHDQTDKFSHQEAIFACIGRLRFSRANFHRWCADAAWPSNAVPDRDSAVECTSTRPRDVGAESRKRYEIAECSQPRREHAALQHLPLIEIASGPLYVAHFAFSACATLDAGSRPSAAQMKRPASAMASRSTP